MNAAPNNIQSVCGIHIRQAGRGANYAAVDIAAVVIDRHGDQEEYSSLIAIEPGADIQFGSLRSLNISFEDLDEAPSWLDIQHQLEAWISDRIKPGDPVVACNNYVGYALDKRRLRVGQITPFNYVANALTWAGTEVATITPVDSAPALHTAAVVAQRLAALYLGETNS